MNSEPDILAMTEAEIRAHGPQWVVEQLEVRRRRLDDLLVERGVIPWEEERECGG